MLIKIIESKRKDKTSKDIYSFECLRNTLSAHDEDGFFLYRVLTKKIATRNKEEEALIDKIVNFYTDEFIVKGEMYLENKMTILIAKIGQNDKVILDFLEIDSVKKRLHEAILKNHFEDLTDGLKKTCEKIRYNFISRGEINSHIKLTYTHLKKYRKPSTTSYCLVTQDCIKFVSL